VTQNARKGDAEGVTSKVDDIESELSQAAEQDALSGPGEAALAQPRADLKDAAANFTP